MAASVLLPGREPSPLPNEHWAFLPVLASVKNTVLFFDAQKVHITALLRCCGLCFHCVFGWGMLCCYSVILKSLLVHTELTKDANKSIHSLNPGRPCGLKGWQKTKVKKRAKECPSSVWSMGWLSEPSSSCPLQSPCYGRASGRQSDHVQWEHFWVATCLITEVLTRYCTSVF